MEVRGRLYRRRFAQMAHFTLLLCLFSAAAYKSEVSWCWGGACRGMGGVELRCQPVADTSWPTCAAHRQLLADADCVVKMLGSRLFAR